MKMLESTLYVVLCVMAAVFVAIVPSFLLGIVIAVLASAFEFGWRLVR